MRKFINLISDKVVWCVDPIFILPNSLWAISHTEEKNQVSIYFAPNCANFKSAWKRL